MTLEPLEGLAVVDLFAGSGALGIEALSRGARHVDFVENEPQALRALERNLEAVGAGDRTKTWRLDLRRGLKRIVPALEAADLILLDPPYGGALARSSLEALSAVRFSRPVRIVVEHHAKDMLPEEVGPLERTRERRYGETQVSTYRVSSQGEALDRRRDGEDS